MRMNKVKQIWREGKPAVGAWLSIPSGFSAEVMAHTGVDWLCIDMQHGRLLPLYSSRTEAKAQSCHLIP